MKPVPFQGSHTVIVNTDPDDKRYFNIHGKDGDISLTGFPDANQDGRIRNPTSGIVLGSSNDVIPDGSYVVFHHNCCVEPRSLDKNVYAISFNLIFAYVPRDILIIRPVQEEDLIPLWPTAFAERIYEKPGMVLSLY